MRPRDTLLVTLLLPLPRVVRQPRHGKSRPAGDDVDLFPWLEGPYWDHATEMQILEHMTDERFSGEELPVDGISGAYDPLSDEPLPDGGRKHTVGPDTGWIATTRLEFKLYEDPDGFWRIREIAEFDLRLPRQSSSFGAIKSLYRTP